MTIPCSWCCHERQTEQTLAVYANCKISNGNPCDICDEYATLESQIRETKRVLDQQLEQQRKLREAMNSVHDPLAPNLPVEITSHIFQHSLTVTWDEIINSYYRLGYPVLEGEKRSRLKLGAVCRAWRDIAWSNPQLWNFISLHISHLGESGSMPLMEEWLSRTGDMPLWVLVATENNIWGDFPKAQIDIINSYSHRWKNLAIIGDSRIMQSLVGQPQGAPILHTLELCFNGVVEDTSFRLTGPKPRPRCVSTNYVFARNVDIEWDDVGILSGSFSNVGDLLEILMNSPRLKTLCIHSINRLDTPLHPACHQNLQSLTLTSSMELPTIFTVLMFPGLTRLSLSMSGLDTYDNVILLLQNSSPIIKEIAIDSFLDQQLFIDLLKHLPFLETLHIRHSCCVDLTLFLSLLRDSMDVEWDTDLAQEDFLPKLQSLIIDDSFHSYLVDLPSNFGGTLSADSARKRPLRSLTLISTHDSLPKEIFF